MSCLKPNKKLKWSLEFTGLLGTNLCIREHGRLDFRCLPGPVFDPPRREMIGGGGGMSAGSFSRTAAGNRAFEQGFIILAQFTQKFGRIIKPLQHQKHFFMITYEVWSKIAIGLLVSLFSTTLVIWDSSNVWGIRKLQNYRVMKINGKYIA